MCVYVFHKMVKMTQGNTTKETLYIGQGGNAILVVGYPQRSCICDLERSGTKSQCGVLICGFHSTAREMAGEGKADLVSVRHLQYGSLSTNRHKEICEDGKQKFRPGVLISPNNLLRRILRFGGGAVPKSGIGDIALLRWFFMQGILCKLLV